MFLSVLHIKLAIRALAAACFEVAKAEVAVEPTAVSRGRCVFGTHQAALRQHGMLRMAAGRLHQLSRSIAPIGAAGVPRHGHPDVQFKRAVALLLRTGAQ